MRTGTGPALVYTNLTNIIIIIPHQPDQVLSSGTVSGSRMASIADSFHLLLLLL